MLIVWGRKNDDDVESDMLNKNVLLTTNKTSQVTN